MPLERRKRIADWPAQYDILVAEDDPYHSLRYTGESLPAIKAFDMDGHVALMGSFSKVISPGCAWASWYASPSSFASALSVSSRTICTRPT